MTQGIAEATTTREELLKQIAELRQIISDREMEIAERDSIIKCERAKLAALQHILFGRKSERAKLDDPKQGQLFNEAELEALNAQSASASEPVAELVKPTAHPKGKKTGGRKRPGPEFIREEVIHDISAEDRHCPHCGSERPVIGEEKSEELDIIPAKVVVKCHIRKKYGPCNCDDFIGHDEKAVITAPAPAKIVPGSLYSNNTAAFILVSKFMDGLPFYRQEQVFRRMRLDVQRSTMARLTIRIATLLAPLIEQIKLDIRGSPVVRMDETTVQVLKEPDRNPSSESRMWVAMGYHEDRKILYFEYSDSRSGDIAEGILGSGFKGYLQTDGYAGYNRLGRRPGIVHVGCWAHIRREFQQIFKSDTSTPAAGAVLRPIQKLYKIERTLRQQLDAHEIGPEEFVRLRKEQALPILEDIRTWLLETHPTVPPRSPLGQALTYALGQFSRAKQYVEHHLLTPDNNLIENAIRPFVIGRKNWLFADTVHGAKASGSLYSLIETAKANGHEPYRYLCHLFEQYPLATTKEAKLNLLPYRLSPSSY